MTTFIISEVGFERAFVEPVMDPVNGEVFVLGRAVGRWVEDILPWNAVVRVASSVGRLFLLVRFFLWFSLSCYCVELVAVSSMYSATIS